MRTPKMNLRMSRIEDKLIGKYLNGDWGYDKYKRIIKIYWDFKKAVQFLPKLIVNTYLCARFPFLKHDINSGFFQTESWYWQIEGNIGNWKRDEGTKPPKLNGWRKAFGMQFCKELKAALKRAGMLRTYEITTIKEKFGALCVYDDGATREVHDILNKYEYISSRTCVECGRPAKYRTTGWIEPYCDECIKNVVTLHPPEEYYVDFSWYGFNRMGQH